MNVAEYSGYDGLGLAELVGRREVAPRELAIVALEAIAIANPSINAVIDVYDNAPDKLPSAPLADAPFAGVPFLLKDIGSHDAGVRCELGSRLAQGLTSPPFASELVTRFRAAGVTVMGRTNVPELGSSCTTEPLLYGATRNPWDLERTSGGSSGGAAAAVAAGMVPIAHANDAGGSIRVPAACCGLVGLKPSRNLNPVGPKDMLPLNGLVAEHIVSRSVRDTAAMLDATAGRDAGAWCFTPRLEGSYHQQAARAPAALRIGMVLDASFPPTTVQETVRNSIRKTAVLGESVGHHVEEAPFDFDAETMLEAFGILWSSNLRSAVDGLARFTGRPINDTTLEPHVLAAWRDAAGIPATKFIWAFDQMNIVARAYGRFFQRYDVMLTPVLPMETFALGKIGALPTARFHDWFLAMCAHSPFTSTANIAGIPAMSLPLFESDASLPIGSQFQAPMGGELTLLKLATQLEAARPWADRLPDHHVSHCR